MSKNSIFGAAPKVSSKDYKSRLDCIKCKKNLIDCDCDRALICGNCNETDLYCKCGNDEYKSRLTCQICNSTLFKCNCSEIDIFNFYKNYE